MFKSYKTMVKHQQSIQKLNNTSHYPLSRLVFKEWLDERVQGMDVPGLVDKMDSSEAGRKAVLKRK